MGASVCKIPEIIMTGFLTVSLLVILLVVVNADFEECHNSMMGGCVCSDRSERCAGYVADGKCKTDDYVRWICEASCKLCEPGKQSADCTCRPEAREYYSYAECGFLDGATKEAADFYALSDTYSHSPADRQKWYDLMTCLETCSCKPQLFTPEPWGYKDCEQEKRNSCMNEWDGNACTCKPGKHLDFYVWKKCGYFTDAPKEAKDYKKANYDYSRYPPVLTHQQKSKMRELWACLKNCDCEPSLPW